MFNRVRLFATLWTEAHQTPPSMEFPRQEYWSGLPFFPPGDLPDPGNEPTSLASPELQDRFFTTGKIIFGNFVPFFFNSSKLFMLLHIFSLLDLFQSSKRNAIERCEPKAQNLKEQFPLEYTVIQRGGEISHLEIIVCIGTPGKIQIRILGKKISKTNISKQAD